METAIDAIEKKAEETIVDKKDHIKIELKEELRNELVTREIFEERFNLVDERFKSLGKEIDVRFNEMNEKFKGLNFKLNIFIAIALIALTFANPTFIKLIEKLFRI